MIFTIRNKTDVDAVKAYIDKCKEGIVYSVLGRDQEENDQTHPSAE